MNVIVGVVSVSLGVLGLVVQNVMGKRIQLGLVCLVVAAEKVVSEQRRQGHGQAKSRHDQSFADRTNDVGDFHLTLCRHSGQCAVNAPHRTEQTDKSGR